MKGEIMRTDIFYWVLNMSVSGTIAGAALLLVRLIKRLPRGAVYLLWAVPFVRFVFPLGFGFEYSVVELLRRATDRIVTVYPEGTAFSNFIEMSTMNYVAAASEYFPIEYKTNYLRVLFEVSSSIWLTVSVVLILIALCLYLISVREVRGATQLGGGIYKSDKVSSPVVVGVIKPRIIVPQDYDCEKNRLAIAHERVHVKRLDNLWRMIAVLLCCVHFFNPIVWVLLKYFFEDMELSADAAILRKLDGTERREYARSLVDAAERKALFSSSFGGAKLKNRIASVVSYKKATAFSSVCAVVFLAAIAIVLLTN